MNLKDVPGYEGVYAASQDGDVYRLRTYGSRPKPILRMVAKRIKKGYAVAHLCLGGERKDAAIHRCVWQAFNGPIPDGLEINHKNGVRNDNRLVNLELVTKSGNARHKFEVLGAQSNFRPQHGSTNGSAKLSPDDIRQIRQMYATGDFRQKDLAGRFGVSQPMIGKIVRGDNWRDVG